MFFNELFLFIFRIDDDLYARASYKFDQIIKLPPEIGRYHMNEHETARPNDERYEILSNARELIEQNGIQEGLSTTKYKVKSIDKSHLYTIIYVTYDRYDFV